MYREDGFVDNSLIIVAFWLVSFKIRHFYFRTPCIDEFTKSA